jgi:hypothetical protein
MYGLFLFWHAHNRTSIFSGQDQARRLRDHPLTSPSKGVGEERKNGLVAANLEL